MNKFWVFLLIGAIIVSWAGYLVGILAADGWSTRGTFGDAFGVINSLFSGLALAGFLIAILLQSRELRFQREELELQREELKLTRKELTRTANAQQESSTALRRQVEIAALTAEMNALVAIAGTNWRGVADAPANIGQLKGQIPGLLESIQKRRGTWEV